MVLFNIVNDKFHKDVKSLNIVNPIFCGLRQIDLVLVDSDHGVYDKSNQRIDDLWVHAMVHLKELKVRYCGVYNSISAKWRIREIDLGATRCEIELFKDLHFVMFY